LASVFGRAKHRPLCEVGFKKRLSQPEGGASGCRLERAVKIVAAVRSTTLYRAHCAPFDAIADTFRRYMASLG